MANMQIPYDSFDSDEAGSTSQASPADDYYAASSDGDQESAAENDINSDHESVVENGISSVEYNTDKVRQKLIETGQLDSLKDLMERRLSEVGWRMEMMAKCREIVQQHDSNISFETLFQPLRQVGQDMVPAEIKDDVMQKIKYCYESETREN